METIGIVLAVIAILLLFFRAFTAVQVKSVDIGWIGLAIAFGVLFFYAS